MKDTGELKDIARQVAQEVVHTEFEKEFEAATQRAVSKAIEACMNDGTLLPVAAIEKMIDDKIAPVRRDMENIDVTLQGYKVNVNELRAQGERLAAAALELRGALTHINKLPDDIKQLSERQQLVEKALLVIQNESTELRHDIFGNGNVPPELTLHGMVKGIYAGVAEQKESIDRLDKRLQLVEQFKESAEMVISASASAVKRSGKGLFDLVSKYRFMVFLAGIAGGIAQWVDDETINQLIDLIIAAISGAPIE